MPIDKLRGQVGSIKMERDRSLHAVCKLSTALHLIAGKSVRVPARAFPAFNPSPFARGLQMINSAIHLPQSMARSRTLVSGPSLAYVSGELEYFRDDVTRRAIRLLSRKQPFFVVSGDPVAILCSQIGCDHDAVPQLRLSSQCVVIVRAKYQGIPAVFRVGRCEEAFSEVSRQRNGIKLAASIAGLQDVVPQFLGHSRSETGLEASIESLLPGVNVPFSWKRMDAILELWPAPVRVSDSPARPFLEQELAEVCDSLPAYQSSLSRFKDSLLQWRSTSPMPGGIVHGDLWLGNVLFQGDSVSGIIDWEWAHQNGMRLLDPLHLLFMSYSVFRNTSIAETLRRFWSGAVADHELNARLNGLSRTFGLQDNDLKFAALLLWFDYLRQRIIRGRMPSLEWTEDMIPRTIPTIGPWLDEQGRGTSEAAA